MTEVEKSEGRRSRGRPVSPESRQAALDAAAALLLERGYAAFTVDEVSRRAAVSKATIYRHWRDGFTLAVESFGATVTAAVPTTQAHDVLAGLRDQVVRLAAFYASPAGRIAAELIGAAVGRDDGGELLRVRFFGPRREATRAVIERGQADGAIRPDLDPDLVNDVVFGAVVLRMFSGLGPLNADDAATVANVSVAAVTAPPSSPRNY